MQGFYQRFRFSVIGCAKMDLAVDNVCLHKKTLILLMNALLNSKQVMVLLNIKSETTLIKYEREGLVKVARRFGNQKRYSAVHIAKLTGN